MSEMQAKPELSRTDGKSGNKVALVSCSNGLSAQMQPQMEDLVWQLQTIGVEPVLSPYLYAVGSVAAGTARPRAEILMQ